MRSLIALLTLTLLPPHPLRAQAGDAGFAFLKLGISGRSVALADALTADASGAAAVHNNPAGLLRPLRGDAGVEALFMHRTWIEDTRLSHLGAAVRLGEADALGFALTSVTVPDIEVRTRPGPPESSFDARNLLLGASWAHRVSAAVQAGITAKLLYQKILVDESTGFGVDAGVQVDPGLADGLTFGALLANLGTGGTLRTDATTLPALLRAGAAWRTPLSGISADLRAGADLVQNFATGSTSVAGGAELEVDRIVAVRAGYQTGSTARGLSLGLGVAYSLMAVDYAFAPLSEDLGGTHAISLALSF